MGDFVKSHTLRTIREEFDDYLLEDGNTLRIKDVLIGFGFSGKVKTGKDGKPVTKAFFNLKQVLGVIPTADVNTDNLEVTTKPVLPSDRIKKISFKEIKKSMNFYETDEFLIMVRNRLDEVWTTPYKDNNNIPIYSIISKAALDAPNKVSLAPFKDETAKK